MLFSVSGWKRWNVPNLKRFISSSPLKVAYFGSDQFSVLSLQKLHNYQNQNQSIDLHVITRSIKPTGRKLKTYKDLPIGSYCQQHHIKISRADTSKDILNLLHQNKFDLAIAVSYGKLIPESFLNNCRYGGINVHPSLLPRYSGSSPIQYTILNDDYVSGCTIQTLHPTKFDRGDIILQSEEVPVRPDEKFAQLRDRLGEIGGDLLVEVIKKNLYEDPLPLSPKYNYSFAPKITSNKSEILWNKYTTRNIIRLNDALGKIHTFLPVKVNKNKENFYELRKVILDDILPLNETEKELSLAGQFALDDDRLVIKTIDGFITVGSLKMQYCTDVDANKFIIQILKGDEITPTQFTTKDQ